MGSRCSTPSLNRMRWPLVLYALVFCQCAWSAALRCAVQRDPSVFGYTVGHPGTEHTRMAYAFAVAFSSVSSLASTSSGRRDMMVTPSRNAGLSTSTSSVIVFLSRSRPRVLSTFALVSA